MQKISIVFNEVLYLIREKLPSIGKAIISQNGVYARWGKFPNFGDQLTPLLLNYYGFTPIYSQYKPSYGHKADFICVGTMLQLTPSDFSGIILGTGMDNVTKEFPKATILGVRGKLTRDNLNIKDKKIILGDPGLLVSYIYPENIKKKWVLGIIPHFMDKNETIVQKWKDKFGDNVTIIDVQQSPKKVITVIKQCSNIISSSLHGLIVADAFDIPNIMFTIRNNPLRPTNDDHKFKDYYSALGIDFKLLEPNGDENLDELINKTSAKGHLVKNMKNDLNQVFKNLHDLYSPINKRD